MPLGMARDAVTRSRRMKPVFCESAALPVRDVPAKNEKAIRESKQRQSILGTEHLMGATTGFVKDKSSQGRVENPELPHKKRWAPHEGGAHHGDS